MGSSCSNIASDEDNKAANNNNHHKNKSANKKSDSVRLINIIYKLL